MKKLLVILFVLFFVTPAFSEQYQLWNQHTFHTAQNNRDYIQSSQWKSYINIFDSKKQCMSYIDVLKTEDKNNPNAIVKIISGENYIIKYESKSSEKYPSKKDKTTWRYYCFPVGIKVN